jgi:intraflagellar transport protein 80
MSNPKFQGLRVEFLNSGFLSLSTDIVAVVDTSNTKLVKLFDLMSGKPLSQNFEHNLEILEVAAN